jgi:hypothetical protein
MNKTLVVLSLTFILFLHTKFSYCQDILYRKATTEVHVKILDFDGRTLIYQMQGDTTNRTFFLNKTEIDSLKYSNGRILRFPADLSFSFPARKLLNRSRVSIESFDIISGLINVEYERLSKTGSSGFVAGLTVNSSASRIGYWDNEYSFLSYTSFNPFYFFIRTGYEFFPFNYSLERSTIARTSIGLFALAGACKKVRFDENYPYSYSTYHAFLAIVTWDVKERFYVGNNFEIATGVEISLLPFLTFFHPKLCFTLSF